MEERRNNDIINFYDACTDLQNAKLILAESKIGKILKTIMESPDLFATVGECLINFNYEMELKKAEVRQDAENIYFKLPADKAKLVALVFNLLSECDTHKLDLHAFIKEFFVSDSGDMSYGFLNFVHKVVFPFRDALCSIMVGEEIEEEPAKVEEEIVQEEIKVEEEPAEGDLLGEFYKDVTKILKNIKETVMIDYKIKEDRRDEINITIDGMIESLDMGNLKIMNALVISLYYLLKPVKSVRFYKEELENRLRDFYANL